jgi:cytochrome b561
MSLRNTTDFWGHVAQLFHWLMALLIFAMISLGLLAKNWPLSPTKLSLFYWHKSFGILILGLVALRLLWRWLNPTPVLPPAMPRWERKAARITHALLYAVMIVMPLSGWIINSAAKFPFKVFGVWRLPAIIAPDKALQQLVAQVHFSLFLLLVILLTLHIAAALRHHFMLRDDILFRMLPGSHGNSARKQQ